MKAKLLFLYMFLSISGFLILIVLPSMIIFNLETDLDNLKNFKTECESSIKRRDEIIEEISEINREFYEMLKK